MTGPPTAKPSTDSAQIREQQIAALKFRPGNVDVLDNNRRVDVISQAEAILRLRIGGYEAVGNNTVKYIRRLPLADQLPDGPLWKNIRRAQGNFTITTTGNLHEHISSKRKGL